MREKWRSNEVFSEMAPPISVWKTWPIFLDLQFLILTKKNHEKNFPSVEIKKNFSLRDLKN